MNEVFCAGAEMGSVGAIALTGAMGRIWWDDFDFGWGACGVAMGSGQGRWLMTSNMSRVAKRVCDGRSVWSLSDRTVCRCGALRSWENVCEHVRLWCFCALEVPLKQARGGGRWWLDLSLQRGGCDVVEENRWGGGLWVSPKGTETLGTWAVQHEKKASVLCLCSKVDLSPRIQMFMCFVS